LKDNRRLREKSAKFKRLYSESRCRERWVRKVREPKGQDHSGHLAITVHGGPERVTEASSTEEEEEPSRPQNETTCYKCGKVGHKAYECREATRREALKKASDSGLGRETRPGNAKQGRAKPKRAQQT
jgi:hypothetical protein